jgi:long-chain fatty acid transport protein
VLPIPNPQVAFNIHALDRLAIGVAVVAPHATGKSDWPTTITYPNRFGIDQEVPAPQRYMVIGNDLLALFPTVAVAFAPIEELSFGAGFVWGVVRLKFETMAEANSPPNAAADDFTRDVSAELDGIDGFVPGFVASVAAAPHERVELAAWFRWSDATSMDIDLYGKAPYYDAAGAVNQNPDVTDVPAAGHFRVQIPMEAKIGVRYRHPREGAESQDFVDDHGGFVRDSWSQDLFDIELDLTWANNSGIETIEVTMYDEHPIVGTPGRVPLDASQPHQWKDAFGFRLGGSVMPIPDFLAVRLGGWFESSSVDPEYLSLDFHAAAKGGIATGLGLRLGIVDLNAAYQHTFFADIDNGGVGAIPTVSGDDGTPDNRSRFAKNGGRSSRRIDEIALGATVHF